MDELKQKERSLAERALGPEREREVVKEAMVNLQQTLTDNTRALNARHIGVKVAATRRTKKLDKLTRLVEICKWRHPDKQ